MLQRVAMAIEVMGFAPMANVARSGAGVDQPQSIALDPAQHLLLRQLSREIGSFAQKAASAQTDVAVANILGVRLNARL